MKFTEVVGQEQVKSQLKTMVESGRISHTMMFAGPKGSGKLPLAMAYAQYLLCENPTPEDSCGVCKSCRRIASLQHPDVHLVYPVIKKKSTDKPKSEDFIELFREQYLENPYMSYMDWVGKLNAENKQAWVFVSENESIMHKLSLKSYGGSYKIFIFWMMERVNIETANKLLKSLEEPPEKTIFLLISDQTELILPTIISRSQLIKSQVLQSTDIVKGLEQRYEIPASEAELYATFADGDFNKAIQLYNSGDELNENLDRFSLLFRESFKFNLDQIIALVNDFKNMSREKLMEFLQYALFLIRNNMALNLHVDKIVHLTTEESNFSKNFSKIITPTVAQRLSKEFEDAIFHISRNVNTRIVMMDLSFRIHEAIKPERTRK